MSNNIAPTGYWTDRSVGHSHDPVFAERLSHLFAGSSVIDLGCGDAYYVGELLKAGVSAVGIDGNPETLDWDEAYHRSVLVADLTKPINPNDFPPGRLSIPADWVMCIEVAEHIHSQYERQLLDNIDRCNKNGVVLSWATVGQGGHGHVNERPIGYVCDTMHERDYQIDDKATAELVAPGLRFFWLNHAIVFRRRGS